MHSKSKIVTGLTAVFVGAAMAVAAMSGSGTAFSQVPPCDSTATSTPLPLGVIRASQAIPTCTATTVTLKTHTPTSTATSGPSNTPAPSSTAAPTKTSVPATSTPSGGAGAGVRPPNTGSGDGTSGGNVMLLSALGVLLMLGGGTVVLTGVRKR